MATAFDIETARQHFPALNQEQVFFDNAGGSQVLGTVIDSITSYLYKNNVQLGATYAIGEKSTAAYRAGQEACAKYVNADLSEVVLGPSTTQLFRNLSQALQFSEGDEIVLSKCDHEANVAAWLTMAERQRLKIKWWTPAGVPNAKLEAEDLKPLLSDRTRFVACTHASNILGSIHDIKSIARAVHSTPRGMLCVDGVAYAPHRQIDVKDLEVDFYSFSWYKVYGPHIAMLYANGPARDSLVSLGHYFNSHKTLENKLGLAGASYELAQSIPDVVAYLGSEPLKLWQAITDHEQKLQAVLLDYLNSREDVTVWGEKSSNPELRVPTVSFTIRGRSSKDVVERLEGKSPYGFRWGAFYSNRLVEEVLGLGEAGVIRVSMVHYNLVEEIQGFVKALDALLETTN